MNENLDSFKMIFPDEDRGDLKDGSKSSVSRTHKAVLLVEDEEMLREITVFALSNYGFKVYQAADGYEAVEMFTRHCDEIGCLLCDMIMPRMGGWETISALRAVRQDLPVILTSGSEMGSAMEFSHRELPDYFLAKPYDLNKLGKTVENIILLKAYEQKERMG